MKQFADAFYDSVAQVHNWMAIQTGIFYPMKENKNTFIPSISKHIKHKKISYIYASMRVIDLVKNIMSKYEE